LARRSLACSATREELEDLKVSELKDQLRDMGLKVGGNKSELIERIVSDDGTSKEDNEAVAVIEEEEEEEVVDEGDTLTEAEKELMMSNVFTTHGFFPDLRTDSELPRSARKMRQQPKSKSELEKLKGKYNSMNESDACAAILVDLGLMEDYSSLEEYSDDFDDYAS